MTKDEINIYSRMHELHEKIAIGDFTDEDVNEAIELDKKIGRDSSYVLSMTKRSNFNNKLGDLVNSLEDVINKIKK